MDQTPRIQEQKTLKSGISRTVEGMSVLCLVEAGSGWAEYILMHPEQLD